MIQFDNNKNKIKLEHQCSNKRNILKSTSKYVSLYSSLPLKLEVTSFSSDITAVNPLAEEKGVFCHTILGIRERQRERPVPGELR